MGEIFISINLSEDEEKLLNRLADTCNISRETALTRAMLVGARWDTYVYEKMASMLWQMQKCSYEESEQLVDTYKQKVEADWEEFMASKMINQKVIQLIRKAKEAERERILQDTEQEGEMELE